MKFSLINALVFSLAAEATLASSWFGKAAYNKWHQNELERWLSDHDVPYPTPADRKDLENLVKSNWQAAVESPYANWDTNQLQKQIQSQGAEVKKGTEKNTKALQDQVKATWADTSDSASTAYGSTKDWFFDSWTDSSLKAFADKHGIPVPQPRKRDQLLSAVRDNSHSASNKIQETLAYPGNWVYDAWSDSDLKAWLDERGIPVPQPGPRDKLIASVRRNSRTASLNAQSAAKKAASSASSGAAAASSSFSESLLASWSDSDIKAWADKNGIKVPQGSTRNELMAIARKNAAKLTGDNLSYKASSAGSSIYGEGSKSAESAYNKGSKSAQSAGSSGSSVGSKSGSSAYSVASKSGASAYDQAGKSAESVYGAATSAAGNQYARATDDASLKATQAGNQIYNVIVSYIDEIQIALGIKTNYASSISRSAASASKSASSVYSRVTKGEL